MHREKEDDWEQRRDRLREKISDRHQIDEMRREHALQGWRSAVEKIIDEAQKNGMFDNLPGRGKPLKLNKNPYAEDRALAYELLQNNDYTLPWIAERKEMLGKIKALRAELQQEWRTYRADFRRAGESDRLSLALEWRAYLDDLERRFAKLNGKITALNLRIPVERLEIFKLNLSAELERVGAHRSLQ